MSKRKRDTNGDAQRVYRFIGDNDYPPRPLDICHDLGFSEDQLDRSLVHLRGAGRICEGSTLPTVYIDPSPPAA